MGKVFNKEIICFTLIHSYFVFPIKERITQIPNTQRFITEIFILYLFQAPTTHISFYIYFPQSVRINQWILKIYNKRKAMCYLYIVENRKEYYEKFFIKINNLLSIYRRNIYRSLILNNSR